jgi:hypothetical protein
VSLSRSIVHVVIRIASKVITESQVCLVFLHPTLTTLYYYLLQMAYGCSVAYCIIYTEGGGALNCIVGSWPIEKIFNEVSGFHHFRHLLCFPDDWELSIWHFTNVIRWGAFRSLKPSIESGLCQYIFGKVTDGFRFKIIQLLSFYFLRTYSTPALLEKVCSTTSEKRIQYGYIYIDHKNQTSGCIIHTSRFFVQMKSINAFLVHIPVFSALRNISNWQDNFWTRVL